MFTFFEKESIPPELLPIYKEMQKLVQENEKLRQRVSVLEQRQEAMRKAINIVAKTQKVEIPNMTDFFTDYSKDVVIETREENGVKTTKKTVKKKSFLESIFG